MRAYMDGLLVAEVGLQTLAGDNGWATTISTISIFCHDYDSANRWTSLIVFCIHVLMERRTCYHHDFYGIDAIYPD